MRKIDELSNPDSCMSRARPDELTFVVLERDICAPGTVRDWCRRRVRAGKNKWGDTQIAEAQEWADTVEEIHRASAIEQERGDANCRKDATSVISNSTIQYTGSVVKEVQESSVSDELEKVGDANCNQNSANSAETGENASNAAPSNPPGGAEKLLARAESVLEAVLVNDDLECRLLRATKNQCEALMEDICAARKGGQDA